MYSWLTVHSVKMPLTADLQNAQKLFSLLGDLPFFICFFSNLTLFTRTQLSLLVLNFQTASPGVCLAVLTHHSPICVFTPATDFTNSWQKCILWSQLNCGCCPLLWDLLQSTTKSKHEFCCLLDTLPGDKHQNSHECMRKWYFWNDPWGFSSLSALIQEFLWEKLPLVELAADLHCNVFSFMLSRLEHPKAGRKDDRKKPNNAENGQLGPISAKVWTQNRWTWFTTTVTVVPFVSLKPVLWS